MDWINYRNNLLNFNTNLFLQNIKQNKIVICNRSYINWNWIWSWANEGFDKVNKILQNNNSSILIHLKFKEVDLVKPI